MRVIVCGSRDWTDEQVIYGRLLQLPDSSVVITGGCRGADAIAADLVHTSSLLALSSETFPADWKTHGKAAGPIRNRHMLDAGCDLVIAFHPDIESSKGTKHMVDIAGTAGVSVEIITGQSGDER
jgi:hypothetical protein